MTKRYALGFDIGGTKIAAGLVDLQKGKVLKKIKISTGKKVSQVAKDVIGIIEKMSRKKIPVGIGCAGQIDSKQGKIIYSPNMPQWHNILFLEILQKEAKKISPRIFQIAKEIKIDNDATCFTLAEWKFGAGRGYKNVVGLTLGTGVGSGVVIEGKLYHGKMSAPELGHLVIEAGGRRCSCGKLGHLEAYSSGRAIEERYLKLRGKKMMATDIEKRVYLGEKEAKEVFAEAKKYLVIGLANIVSIFDPEVIILGGTIGIKSKLIWRGLNHLVEKNLFFREKKVLIKKAKLGDEAGIIGGALLVLD